MLSLNNFCQNATEPVDINTGKNKRNNRKEIEEAIMVLQSEPKGRATDQAMSFLIKQFYKYITKCAMKIDPMNFDDKVIAGCEGLLYAARNFDLEEDTQFFTYAHSCISGYMYQDTRDGRLIHITSTMMKGLKKPGNEQLYAYAMNPISLNVAMYESDGTDESEEMEDYIEDVSISDAVDQMYNDQTEQMLKDIIYENDETATGDVTFADIYCQHKGLFGNPAVPLSVCSEVYEIDPKVLKRNFNRIRKRIRNSIDLRKHLNISKINKKRSKKLSDISMTAEPVITLGKREQAIREKEEFDSKYSYNKRKKQLEFNFYFD